MQNRFTNNKSAFGRIGVKGFYIALCLCLVIVAAAGYVINQRNSGQIDLENKLGEGQDVGSDIILPVEDEDEDEILNEAEETEPEDEQSFKPYKEEKAAEPNTAPNMVHPVNGEVSVPYSEDEPVYSITLDDWRTHNGVDLKGSVGTPVAAFMAGEVVDVYEDNMLGWTVIIKHSNTLASMYSNLSSAVPVEIGQTVEAGDTIGGIGETAMSEILDVPHLHFSIIEKGKHVDPAKYIK